MKKILFAVMAFGALVACTNEEVIEMDREQIGFGEAFVDNATRAADPSYTATTLEEFKVWGTATNADDTSKYAAIFADNTVKGTVGTGSVWNADKAEYWIPGAKYNFVGLVNAGAVTLTQGLPSAVEFTYTDGSVDLLYAKSIEYTGATSNNPLVALQFGHLLSKVNVVADNQSTSATGYSFVIKNITFAGTTKGTCTLDTKAWATTTSGNITASDIAVASGTTQVDLPSELLLIPGNVTISATVDTVYGGQVIRTQNLSTTTTFASSTAYKVNVVLKVGEQIQFTVTEAPTGWINGDAVTIS